MKFLGIKIIVVCLFVFHDACSADAKRPVIDEKKPSASQPAFLQGNLATASTPPFENPSDFGSQCVQQGQSAFQMQANMGPK